jgi:2-oxoglutarate dehydrogenase E1 component
MLEQYEADPTSVPESWQVYFKSLDNDTATSSRTEVIDDSYFNQPTIVLSSNKTKIAPSAALTTSLPSDSLGVAHLIRAYQVNGHRSANLDPLGLHTNESFPFRPGNARSPTDMEEGMYEALTVKFHGFDPERDMDRELNFKGVHTGGNKGFLEDLTSMPGRVTLRKVLDRLRQTYCGTLGVEYMHIGSTEQCNWIRERVENPNFLKVDNEKKMHIFERLCFADTFENFLANKFNTTKRFGLDGGEAIVPALKDAIDRASELGAHSFIIGMPHRGRLNVLANVMRKPMTTLFAEFQGTHYDEKLFTKNAEDWGSAGDVKVSFKIGVVVHVLCCLVIIIVSSFFSLFSLS